MVFDADDGAGEVGGVAVRETTQITDVMTTEAAILSRVIITEPDSLPAEAANVLLKLGFPSKDRERMHELVVKNQADTLTDLEKHELDSYVRIGRLLDQRYFRLGFRIQF